MPNQDDQMVARAVIEARLATQEEVAACLKIKAELARKGEGASLADILVQEGILTRNQLDRAMSMACSKTA